LWTRGLLAKWLLYTSLLSKKERRLVDERAVSDGANCLL
jgi:hypothetical protein